MKICLYTETALPKTSGQELIVDRLASVPGAGTRSRRDEPIPSRRLRGLDRSLPYPVVRHPRFISSGHGIGWYRHFIQALYRKFAFDVLHCQGINPCGYLGGLCRSRIEAALLITPYASEICDGSPRLTKSSSRARTITTLERADVVISTGRITTSALRRLCPAATLTGIPHEIDDAKAAIGSCWQEIAARHLEVYEQVRSRTLARLAA